MVRMIKGMVYLLAVVSVISASICIGWMAGHHQGVIDGEGHCDFTLMLLRNRINILEQKLKSTNTYIIQYFTDKELICSNQHKS